MGISAIYKQLEFDGEASGDFDLYISGEGAFNAPQRDVEMVNVPGRNGSLPLDHGRFENIEITYPAGVFGVDEADFADKIAEIRAWLCSKKGYVRLTDDYNPNEYRMAVYKSGLGVSPAILKAGEFDLVFDAMPQRFLTSGDTAETIASSGDTLTNPTRFASRPLLEVNGYGAIAINGTEVEIRDGALGEVLLASGGSISKGENYVAVWNISPNYASLNTGDPVVLKMGATYFSATLPGQITSVSNFTQSGSDFASPDGTWGTASFPMVSGFTFNYGTAKSSWAQADFTYQDKNGNTQTIRLKAQIQVNAAGRIQMGMIIPGYVLGNPRPTGFKFSIANIYGDSSQSVYGNPLYLDLDIGEAYKIENDEIVSVNQGVFLGAELPELESGANVITFDNTITALKVVPRWWTV